MPGGDLFDLLNKHPGRRLEPDVAARVRGRGSWAAATCRRPRGARTGADVASVDRPSLLPLPPRGCARFVWRWRTATRSSKAMAPVPSAVRPRRSVVISGNGDWMLCDFGAHPRCSAPLTRRGGRAQSSWSRGTKGNDDYLTGGCCAGTAINVTVDSPSSRLGTLEFMAPEVVQQRRQPRDSLWHPPPANGHLPHRGIAAAPPGDLREPASGVCEPDPLRWLRRFASDDGAASTRKLSWGRQTSQPAAVAAPNAAYDSKACLGLLLRHCRYCGASDGPRLPRTGRHLGAGLPGVRVLVRPLAVLRRGARIRRVPHQKGAGTIPRAARRAAAARTAVAVSPPTETFHHPLAGAVP